MVSDLHDDLVMLPIKLEAKCNALHHSNTRLRKALAAVLDVGFVAWTEDGLYCNYCGVTTDYPDESGDYAHTVLNHKADCVYVIAKGVLEEMERDASAEGGDDER